MNGQAEWNHWRKMGKSSLTDASSFKCLSPLSSVNINFYVNKYLLKSWQSVKLQASLWGHSGEQYTGNIKAHHLEKKSPLEFIDYTGVFIKFITQGPIDGSKKGIPVPSRNLQSSWESKNYAHNSRREYLIVKRNDADKRAEEKETNESNMIRAGRLEPGNCDWVRGKRKTF